jgi:sRNA-binding carbon storage regulator CsrA
MLYCGDDLKTKIVSIRKDLSRIDNEVGDILAYKLVMVYLDELVKEVEKINE